LKKIDTTKLKGASPQDKGTPFKVRDFHHEGVGLVLNIRTIPRAVLHSFVQLEAHKT